MSIYKQNPFAHVAMPFIYGPIYHPCAGKGQKKTFEFFYHLFPKGDKALCSEKGDQNISKAFFLTFFGAGLIYRPI
jgi:hypothetical protein